MTQSAYTALGTSVDESVIYVISDATSGTSGTSGTSSTSGTSGASGTSGTSATLASTADAIAGTSTISAPTAYGNAASEAIIKNPLALSQGLQSIYSATAGGITIANNGNANFGTNGFTIRWKGSVPDWTPSAAVSLYAKGGTAGTDGYAFGIETSGALSVRLAASTVTSSTTSGLTDGVAADLVASVNVSATTTLVDFYVNGNALGTQKGTSGHGTVTTSSDAFMLSNSIGAILNRSVSESLMLFNRVLTAADVLDLYRNGLPYSDKWGSATAAYTSDFSAGTDGWSVVRGTRDGNIDSIGGENDWLRFYSSADATTTHYVYRMTVSPYKRYRVTGKVYIANSGGTTYLDGVGITLSGSSSTIGQLITTLGSVVPFDFEMTAASTYLHFFARKSSAYNFTGANSVTDDLFYVKDIVVTEVGATLALEPEGLQPPPGQWLDSSTNKIHAMQPTTGTMLAQSKKEFEFRWTNTWSASSAAQYIGGLNQAVLSAKHFITSIVSRATVTTSVQNITIGDGSDADYYVGAVAPTAAPIIHTLLKNLNDGTNMKLVVTPAGTATMTIEFIVKGYLLE